MNMCSCVAAIKAEGVYGGEEVKRTTFFTPVLDKEDWSA
jgi:hypothetical protein